MSDQTLVPEKYLEVIKMDHPAHFLAEQLHALSKPRKIQDSNASFGITTHNMFIPVQKVVSRVKLNRLLAEYYEVNGGECGRRIFDSRLHGVDYAWTPNGVLPFLFTVRIAIHSSRQRNPGVEVETVFLWK